LDHSKELHEYFSRRCVDKRDYYLEASALRRARMSDAICGHSVCNKIDRRAVWGRDEGCCRIKLVCNGDFVPFEKMHLDHVIPLTRGGLHCYYNVQTGCAPCNLSKSNRILEKVF
jgi:5-methylcytosine-specific restriction endonuclease McrA